MQACIPATHPDPVLLEIIIVIALIVVNGLLAMSELAVVSARPVRLKVLADGGSHGARTAMELAEHPGKFLSTVQIGITLVGVLSGAFSGATLGTRLAGFLRAEGMAPATADALGVGIVVAIITYLSLIIGELVPKQIALRDPESVASRVAPAMVWLSRLTTPIVWFLDVSGRLVLRLLGQAGEDQARVTEEEVRSVLAEAQVAGVIETGESAMLSGVMRLADRNARGLMTPRRDVETVDIDATPEELLTKLRETRYSKLPVRDRANSDIAGVIYVKDVYDALSAGLPVDLRSVMQEVPVVSDLANALDVVEVLRDNPRHMALVFDEYGEFEGIVTSGDILEAITGVFRESETEEPAIFERADGSFLVAGWMPADEFCDRINYPRDSQGGYETVAGLVLHELQRMPVLGDHFENHGWRFEVVDLDERRIDKLMVSPVAEAEKERD